MRAQYGGIVATHPVEVIRADYEAHQMSDGSPLCVCVIVAVSVGVGLALQQGILVEQPRARHVQVATGWNSRPERPRLVHEFPPPPNVYAHKDHLDFYNLLGAPIALLRMQFLDRRLFVYIVRNIDSGSLSSFTLRIFDIKLQGYIRQNKITCSEMAIAPSVNNKLKKIWSCDNLIALEFLFFNKYLCIRNF